MVFLKLALLLFGRNLDKNLVGEGLFFAEVD